MFGWLRKLRMSREEKAWHHHREWERWSAEADKWLREMERHKEDTPEWEKAHSKFADAYNMARWHEKQALSYKPEWAYKSE